MANDKSNQKARLRTSKVIIGLIVLLLSILFGIDLNGIISALSPETTKTNETQPEQTYLETTQLSSSVEGQLVVHMIDVGQADCFLLVQGETTALVDCGTRSTGKKAVTYLQELGITDLDYVIGTHPHDDDSMLYA